VVLDVVRRYDIDGVHIDDYFYPYPVKDRGGKVLPFPDWTSWKKYRSAGGKLERDDWRRENVNEFVRRLYDSIKSAKPHVKFGISPFGIWRPGHPPGIRGQDAYAALYADARKWLTEGWLDYIAPQLYWPASAKEQSYPLLLRWWAEQNVKGRHLWPGNSHRNSRDEILNQIELARNNPRATGNIHWSVRALIENRDGVADALGKRTYSEAALVPASQWLDRIGPSQPALSVQASSSAVEARWHSRDGESASLWLVQAKSGNRWQTQILPRSRSGLRWLGDVMPEAIAVTAVDRCGNNSTPAVVEKRTTQSASR
jgi:uncharacterized lipoprotein YddW (UPF0748 family)